MSATTSEALLAAAADAVARARQVAIALGSDHPGVWLILELAAGVESSARALEVEWLGEDSLVVALAEESA